jgi:hypothetical protein
MVYAFHTSLWATSFHDYVLREEDDIKGVGRYTLRNPIEGGLVKNILDYPFCGSFIYDLRELIKSDPFLNGPNYQA